VRRGAARLSGDSSMMKETSHALVTDPNAELADASAGQQVM
jgi:hypothetical protein